MFKFRGQSTLTGEWVTGWHFMDVGLEKHYIVSIGVPNEIHPSSLSISTGKLDSNKQEIFASFEIDGVMTEGGDVVEGISGGAYPVFYNTDNTSFELKLRRIGKEVVLGSLYTNTLTIIGKGGGNDK